MRTPRKIHTCLFFVPCWVVEFHMACVTTQDRQPSFQIFFSEGQRFTANELTTPPKKTTILTVWHAQQMLVQQTSHLKKHVLHTTHTILFMFVCYALLDHQMKCLLAHWKLPEDRSAPKTVEGNVGGVASDSVSVGGSVVPGL